MNSSFRFATNGRSECRSGSSGTVAYCALITMSVNVSRVVHTERNDANDLTSNSDPSRSALRPKCKVISSDARDPAPEKGMGMKFPADMDCSPGANQEE